MWIRRESVSLLSTSRKGAPAGPDLEAYHHDERESKIPQGGEQRGRSCRTARHEAAAAPAPTSRGRRYDWRASGVSSWLAIDRITTSDVILR